MNLILLQVLGLVAFINAHKASKARNLAESGTVPTSPIPVRQPRTFKKCFTIMVVTYIALSVVGAAIEGAVEGWQTRQMYKLEQLHKLETRGMYMLRR